MVYIERIFLYSIDNNLLFRSIPLVIDQILFIFCLLKPYLQVPTYNLARNLLSVFLITVQIKCSQSTDFLSLSLLHCKPLLSVSYLVGLRGSFFFSIFLSHSVNPCPRFISLRRWLLLYTT